MDRAERINHLIGLLDGPHWPIAWRKLCPDDPIEDGDLMVGLGHGPRNLIPEGMIGLGLTAGNITSSMPDIDLVLRLKEGAAEGSDPVCRICASMTTASRDSHTLSLYCRRWLTWCDIARSPSGPCGPAAEGYEP
jgi:hypothetical protein